MVLCWHSFWICIFVVNCILVETLLLVEFAVDLYLIFFVIVKAFVFALIVR